MKGRAKRLLDRFSVILEYFIAGVLCIGLLYFTFELCASVLHLPNHSIYESFDDLLHGAFTLVIGVEIIRMLCEHSTEIVFEVLTFAIARQIVISHSSAIDNVYGMVALAMVFAVRKYVYSDTLNTEHPKKKKTLPERHEAAKNGVKNTVKNAVKEAVLEAAQENAKSSAESN
ncbi:MAG: hypothetical protein IJD21_04175 [Oscillospiraceae bacterium]|nr:hypothetical protein [Oscillospiraceae bacterium]